MQLILASQSPRRKTLLSSLGYKFLVEPSNKDEIFDHTLPVDEALVQVAMAKAKDILASHPNTVVLAADTIVYDQGKILGKPADTEEAFQTLKSLSGREHEVKTAVVLLSDQHTYSHVETTKVCFKPITDTQIQEYINLGTCLDKAGSYGIQDINFVDHIEGSYSNVIGLPLTKTDLLLKAIQGDPAVSL